MSSFRCFTTSIVTGAFLADLPVDNLSFSYAVNNAGRAELRFQINDPRLSWAGLNIREATHPNSTALWISYEDVPVWGGLINTVRYQRSAGTLEVTANTWSYYFGSRWQQQDYTYTWMAPADPMAIATRVVHDAFVIPNSVLVYNGVHAGGIQGVPFFILQEGTTPLTNWVTMSYPSIQLQTLQMIVQTLTEMGYTVGFDYADDVVTSDLTPWGYAAQWKIGNPYVGLTPSQTALRLDVATTIDLSVSKDGTNFGNEIVEMSTASGSVMVRNLWAPSIAEHGLWQFIEMHPDVNSTPNVQVTLDGLSRSDLTLSAYSQVRMTATLAAEDPTLPISAWTIGDSVKVVYRGSDDVDAGNDPYLPNPYEAWWRIVSANITVPAHGVATQKLTLNVVPQGIPTPSGL